MKCYSCTPCALSKLALVIVLVVFYFAGCGVSSSIKPPASQISRISEKVARGTAIGQLAPDFELAKVEGGNISFKDLKGKPAVLVFWTAWCPICKEEAPHINKLAAEFGPKGVQVIGINIGESDARTAEGIKDFGIKYSVLKDKDTAVAKSYKVIGTPTIIFLDKQGVVKYFGNELPQDYAERLNGIIGGQNGL